MFRNVSRKSAAFFSALALSIFLFSVPQLSHAAKADIEGMKKSAAEYTAAGNLTEAIKIYNKILRSSPADIEAHKRVAELYMWNDRAKEAIPHYEEILKAEPDNLEIRKNLANVYSWNNMGEKAIEEWKVIHKMEPDNLEIMTKLANNYMWTSQPKEAEEMFRKILELEPDNLEIRKNLANVYSWNGMEKKAIEEWKVIHKMEPDNLEIMINLANNYMWTSRPKEAEEMFNKILKKDPENVRAKTALADLYTYSSRPEKAIALYKQVVNQAKTIEEQKNIYNRMAENYYNTGSYDDAREFYRKLLDVAPGDPVARRQLDNINRLVGPGVFGQFDFYRAKGDSYLFREEAGGTYVFENGLRIKTSGIIESEIDFDENENTYKNTYAVPLEVSKYLGDGLTVFVGASWLQFRSIRTSFNYFINYLKTFGPNMTMEFGYSRNSLEQEHYQHADRHRINHTMYYTPIEYFSIATYLSPFYITKGDASNDNYGIDFSITPIVHVMRENPRIDLSYTYARQYYYRKDNYPDRYYEYYMPNYAMANYITAFLHYDYDETLWFEASNSYTFWGKDEFMKYFSENVVTLEYSYLFDKKGDGRIGVAYLWYRRLKGRIEDSQDSQRWILKYSQSF